MPIRKSQPRKQWPIMVRRNTYELMSQVKAYYRRPFSEQVAIWAERELAAIQSERKSRTTQESGDDGSRPLGPATSPQPQHHAAGDLKSHGEPGR